MSLVYLAGHIAQDDYRKTATYALHGQGHEVLDPFRPEHDLRGMEEGAHDTIVQWDLEDVVRCDLVLANFSDMSVGTSMECWFAHSIHRPVISFVENNKRISPWIHHVSQEVFGNLFDALVACQGYL